MNERLRIGSPCCFRMSNRALRSRGGLKGKQGDLAIWKGMLSQ
jgi:hypothetical protein